GSAAVGASTATASCPSCSEPIPLDGIRGDAWRCPVCGVTVQITLARDSAPLAAMRPVGRFILLDRVGLGAFGSVWRARDTKLDRVVALKIPHPDIYASPADLERFVREARATARLRHPGIVPVHEVLTLDGLPVIVSDFIGGASLRDLLRVCRPTFQES